MILLLKIQFLKIKNRLRHSTGPERLKAAAFTALGLMFFALLHWGALRFLRAVHGVELAGPLLMVKILAMALMTAFFMIVFSATLTSFTTLFFARDLALLVHTPLPHRTLFAFKSLETAVFSSWMMLLALVPFLAAYGRVAGQGIGFYLLLTALGVPFAWLASAGGIGLSLALMRVFPARRVRDIMLAVALVIGTGLFLWVRWLAPARFLRADTMSSTLEYIALLEAPASPWLPSTWVARAVAAFVRGATREAGLYGAALAGAAALAFALLVAAGERAYYAGWASAQEASRWKSRRPLGGEWRGVPRFLGVRFRAILGKDLAVFFRDPNQWSQLLMLASVGAIYLLSIHKLPLDSRFLKGLVSFLNIGMTGFVLASVALRFVFPAVSLEGRSWWALRSAPLGLWEILWSKFLGGVGPIAGLGVLLVAVSNHFLGVDPFVARLSNLTVLVMAVTLAGMGVGFGALFPRFGEENVARIQTSAGGVLFMVTGLLYVGVTLALEAVLMRMHYFSAVVGRSLWSGPVVAGVVGALALVNLLAFFLPLAAGHRRLARADV